MELSLVAPFSICEAPGANSTATTKVLALHLSLLFTLLRKWLRLTILGNCVCEHHLSKAIRFARWIQIPIRNWPTNWGHSGSLMTQVQWKAQGVRSWADRLWNVSKHSYSLGSWIRNSAKCDRAIQKVQWILNTLSSCISSVIALKQLRQSQWDMMTRAQHVRCVCLIKCLSGAAPQTCSQRQMVWVTIKKLIVF